MKKPTDPSPTVVSNRRLRPVRSTIFNPSDTNGRFEPTAVKLSLVSPGGKTRQKDACLTFAPNLFSLIFHTNSPILTRFSASDECTPLFLSFETLPARNRTVFTEFLRYEVLKSGATQWGICSPKHNNTYFTQKSIDFNAVFTIDQCLVTCLTIYITFRLDSLSFSHFILITLLSCTACVCSLRSPRIEVTRDDDMLVGPGFDVQCSQEIVKTCITPARRWWRVTRHERYSSNLSSNHSFYA